MSASLLALKIAYLVKLSGRNRFSVSEAKLKQLAQKDVISIPYLNTLKQNLEELGYFLGTLKKGRYCLLLIESLEGAPSLPIKEDALKQLAGLTEEELEALCITPVIVKSIADNEQDEQRLLINELWALLTKTAIDKQVISYGELAIKLKTIFGYKIHHKKVMVLLEPITRFCSTHHCPTLTYLAINDKLQLPKALEKETEATNKFNEEKINIYGFDWNNQKRDFEEFLNRNKEN